MIVDDNQMSKKRVNLLRADPGFTLKTNRKPVQIVVNRIEKKPDPRATVKARPKYKPSELAASGGGQAPLTPSGRPC